MAALVNASISTPNRPSPVHEAIASNGIWAPPETAILTSVLKKHCQNAGQPQVFLDVGCNIGWFCSVAAAYGCSCMAFDGSAEGEQCTAGAAHCVALLR